MGDSLSLGVAVNSVVRLQTTLPPYGPAGAWPCSRLATSFFKRSLQLEKRLMRLQSRTPDALRSVSENVTSVGLLVMERTGANQREDNIHRPAAIAVGKTEAIRVLE